MFRAIFRSSIAINICLFFCTSTAGAEQPNSFSQIQQIIETKQPKSVEAFIASLSPELRSNFTLVYQSKSIQGASKESPRAVLFSKTGDLEISFNGASSQEGGSSVEVMNFYGPKSQRKSSLHEITFDPKGAMPARISDPNPSRCISCHGSPPIPIWESYPSWPGVYGSHDDTLNNKNELPPGSKVDDSEEKSFKKFKAAVKANGRYNKLLFANNGDSPYLGANEDFGATDLHSSHRPNLRLTTALVGQAGMVVASELKKSPLYDQFKFSFIYSSLCEKDASSLEAVRNKMKETSKNLPLPSQGLVILANAQQSIPDSDSDSPARKLLPYFGVSKAIASLSIEGKSTETSNGFSHMRTPIQIAANLILKEYANQLGLGDSVKEFRNYFGNTHDLEQNPIANDITFFNRYTTQGEKVCRVLKAKSLFEINSSPSCTSPDKTGQLREATSYSSDSVSLANNSNLIADAKLPTALRGKQIVETTCRKCHSSEGMGSRTFFESQEAVMKAIQSPGFVQGVSDRLMGRKGLMQMPPGKPISSSDQNSILLYLKSLEN